MINIDQYSLTIGNLIDELEEPWELSLTKRWSPINYLSPKSKKSQICRLQYYVHGVQLQTKKLIKRMVAVVILSMSYIKAGMLHDFLWTKE